MTAMPGNHIGPGALLGVLGGGQLGTMFSDAAHRLGYRVAVWDPDARAPAHAGADRSVTHPFSHPGGLTEFLRGLSAATYEWENVPAELCEQLELHVPVRPGSRVLRTIQHRGVQKRFLVEHGFPVGPFREVRAAGELDQAGTLGYPCLLKRATAGYDGKGQWRLDNADDQASLRAALPERAEEGRAWLLEAVVPFVRELSVLVACGRDGQCACYPVADNRHEGGILRMTSVPAPIERGVAERAQRLCEAVVRTFESPGVFCVELFQLADDSFLVNEIAPRPHNSGHYTLDACRVSQFEQQVRTLCGLPVGEARLTSPASMINLLGQEVLEAVQGVHLRGLLGQPGVHLHLYRKRDVRPGRKMGHVTVTRETREAVIGLTTEILKAIRPSAAP